MRRVLAITLSLMLLGAAVAGAVVAVITKHKLASVTIAPGATRTLSVPFPDALKYAGARYRGSRRLSAKPGAPGRRPELSKVHILSSHAIEGGSLYAVRAYNANPAGSAPVMLTVTATTIESSGY